MKSMSNRVALVTGGSTGIGRAAAVAFGREGANVAVVSRRADEGDETVRLVQGAGGDAIFVRADVSRAADVEAAVAATVARFGRLDIAVNNAGVEGRVALLAEQEEADFAPVFDVNVKGTWLCMKHVIRHMLGHGGGAVVNVISIHGFRPMVPGLALYTAAKHALVGMTKAAALEYAGSGIRINAVAPGPTVTDMLKRAGGGSTEQFEEFVPMKRLGQPDDIASAIRWLGSDEAAFITGHVLVADGGVLAQ